MRKPTSFLVVDDVADDRERLASEMRIASGVQVVAAPSLTEVLPTPAPDVLVLGVDAAHVAPMVRFARSAFAAGTILVIGYLPAAAAFVAARSGADAFFPKPATGDVLVDIANGHMPSHARLPSLARAQWEYLHAVLALNLGNRSEAARHLGIHRSVLQRKLARAPPLR